MSDIIHLGREPIIPAIPQTPVDDPKLRPVVDAIRNIFRTRASGDQMDNWVTWRHLIDNGIVGYQQGNNVTYGNGSSNFFPVGAKDTNFTPPPAPTNVTITGGFNVIFIEWTGDDYGNHAYSEVWRSATNSFAAAVLQGTTKSRIYTDSVGNNLTYYYWIRFVSTANVYGPYNSTEGTQGKTSLDPTYALQTLAGQITESQLYSSLNSRLNLIDSSAPGSVNARIATESTTRATVDNGLLAQYTVKVDVNGRVAGFGLASTSTGGTPTSSFVVIADKFAVVSPSSTGETPKVPFVVGTVDGQTVVSISSAMIQDAAISTAKINTAAITTAKIADAAISNAKITDAAITTAKIADASITNAKIGSLSVNTANIIDGAITNAKIGDAQITNAKIADANITTAKIADATITAAKIADGNITNAKIGFASIDSSKIIDGEITNAKIQNGSISNAKIGDAQVDTLKIGANAVSSSIFVANTGSITITPPAGAQVLVLLSLQTSGSAVQVSGYRTIFSMSISKDGGVIRNISPACAWYAYIGGQLNYSQSAVADCTYSFIDSGSGAATTYSASINTSASFSWSVFILKR